MRAVVVFVMVDVSSVVVLCFFSVVEVASREGRQMLELAVIDEKDARQSTHF